jgi:cytochrome d ubiquinol oxidase subunit I
VIYGLIGTIMVILVGHNQAQYMFRIQPMKMAAAEALWDTESPASMSLFTIGDEKKREDVFAIRVPALLSILAYNSVHGEVKGINQLQQEYENRFGPGDYVPPVAISYWTFRIMIGAGFAMLLVLVFAFYRLLKNRLEFHPKSTALLILAVVLPYMANSTGWIFTEVARQPWIVFGLFKTADAVSPTVTPGEVLFSLISFTLLYGVLMIADIYLLRKYARSGTIAMDQDTH